MNILMSINEYFKNFAARTLKDYRCISQIFDDVVYTDKPSENLKENRCFIIHSAIYMKCFKMLILGSK